MSFHIIVKLILSIQSQSSGLTLLLGLPLSSLLFWAILSFLCLPLFWALLSFLF